ncbi:hypothetical protein TNCV_438931 [Trichonephila clavipes]|nr:hypothetical protein TNCV_438931 [Trichonephila clavipes]
MGTNHLVGENIDNSSHREDDTPDEEDGQTNAGILSAILGLIKLPTSPEIATGSTDRPIHTRTWGSYTMVHQHIFRLRCITTSMLHFAEGSLDAGDLLRFFHAPRLERGVSWISSSGSTEFVCV